MKGNTTEKNDMNMPALVKKAQDGDKEAFQEIFLFFNDQLYAYAISRTNSKEDATDMVQETFVELWKALKRFKYRSDDEFYGFVFKIMKRRLARHYDAKREVVPFEEEFIAEVYEMDIADYKHIIDEVENLRPKYQELLRLRYWSGMTFPEIAFAMGIKENTAKVWHHRAVQKLKINLEDYE